MKYILRHWLNSILRNFTLAYFKKSTETADVKEGKVFLSPAILIFGIIMTVIILIPAVICLFIDGYRMLSVFLVIFSLLSFSMVLGYINCRIYYDDDGFVAKNILGIKRKFTYDEVTGIKVNTHEKYIVAGKRKVMIDEYAIGENEFINFVRRKYGILHNGRHLPLVYKTKFDLFNGHVQDAEILLFGYILGFVACIGFFVFTVCAVFVPKTVNNTTEQLLCFQYCEVQRKEVILTTVDNQVLKIRFIDEQFSPEAVKAVCDGETELTVYCDHVNPKYEKSFYQIKAIKKNENYILSFDETHRLHKQEYLPLLVFPVFFLLLWTGFVVTSVVVGRNPKKYSKKLVKKLFADRKVRYF